MAEPILFDECTKIITPPRGEETTIMPLPVHIDDGKMISCWQLTPEELEKVQKDGKIFVWVWSIPMPPICISTDPWEN